MWVVVPTLLTSLGVLCLHILGFDVTTHLGARHTDILPLHCVNLGEINFLTNGGVSLAIGTYCPVRNE